jgi:glycosyltransferase involved in cell wall biosynthesis
MHFLLVNPSWPRFDRDSGSFRLFEIVKALGAEGHQVTFATRDARDGERYREALASVGAGVLDLPAKSTGGRAACRQGRRDLAELLRKRPVDVAILYHHRTARHLGRRLRALSPRTMIAVDCVDLHYLRLRREAELQTDPKAKAAGLARAREEEQRELGTYRRADLVIAISEDEAELLRPMLGGVPVTVVSNIHPLPAEVAPFEARRDLFFVGSYDHPPNVDAFEVLATQVLPRVREQLPDVRLIVVGGGKHELEGTDRPGIDIRGFVDELEPVIDGARLMVAPLRFGAGVKGKVGQALAHGLPVVTTTIGAEGLGLTHMQDVLLSDDPAELADLVVRAYGDRDLWQRLSVGGRARIEASLSPERVREDLVRGVVNSPALEGARARRTSWSERGRLALGMGW